MGCMLTEGERKRRCRVRTFRHQPSNHPETELNQSTDCNRDRERARARARRENPVPDSRILEPSVSSREFSPTPTQPYRRRAAEITHGRRRRSQARENCVEGERTTRRESNPWPRTRRRRGRSLGPSRTSGSRRGRPGTRQGRLGCPRSTRASSNPKIVSPRLSARRPTSASTTEGTKERRSRGRNFSKTVRIAELRPTARGTTDPVVGVPGAARGTRRASTRHVLTFSRSHVFTFSRSHSPGKQRRASMEAAARADAAAGTGTGTGSAGPTDNK